MKKSAKQSSDKSIISNVSALKQETSQKETVLVKKKTPEEKKEEHKQSIIKTVVASILGIFSGIFANVYFGTGIGTKWYAALAIIGILAYYIQRFAIFPALKINTKEFGFKDWFYVEFLIIDFCIVTWTLLLN